MQNYLELLDKLLVCEIATESKGKGKERDNEEKEEKLLCGREGECLYYYYKTVVLVLKLPVGHTHTGLKHFDNPGTLHETVGHQGVAGL